jgi:hypothetical protein
MNGKTLSGFGFLAGLSLCLAGAHANEIKTQRDDKVLASFDIVETKVTTKDGYAIFETKVRGDAGKSLPQALRRLRLCLADIAK